MIVSIDGLLSYGVWEDGDTGTSVLWSQFHNSPDKFHASLSLRRIVHQRGDEKPSILR